MVKNNHHVTETWIYTWVMLKAPKFDPTVLAEIRRKRTERKRREIMAKIQLREKN